MGSVSLKVMVLSFMVGLSQVGQANETREMIPNPNAGNGYLVKMGTTKTSKWAFVMQDNQLAKDLYNDLARQSRPVLVRQARGGDLPPGVATNIQVVYPSSHTMSCFKSTYDFQKGSVSYFCLWVLNAQTLTPSKITLKSFQEAFFKLPSVSPKTMGGWDQFTTENTNLMAYTLGRGIASLLFDRLHTGKFVNERSNGFIFCHRMDEREINSAPVAVDPVICTTAIDSQGNMKLPQAYFLSSGL